MHIYTNTLLLIYNCRSQLNKEKWHEQYIHGCHSHNLSTSKVLTWNDMRLFLQNFMPKRKQNGMIWSFWNLHLICHYVQKTFWLAWLTQEEQMPPVSKRASTPGTESYTDGLRPAAYHFADVQISNGSLCFASAAMAPVINKSMLI